MLRLLFLTLLLPLVGHGLPRYSARYNQSCHLCHVNPEGGGMRTSFGSQFFAGTELAMNGFDFDKLGALETRISDRLSVGADFRTLLVHDSPSDGVADRPANTYENRPELSSFLQMQGDLYLHFNLAPRYEMVYEQALSGSWEAWALAHVLPANGSVKVGRFMPGYGWKTVDHNAFTRERLGFSTRNREQDTGVELEFHPDGYSFSLALTNGINAQFDDNTQKALTGRVAHMTRVMGKNLTLGASARVNRLESLTTGARTVSVYGPFAALHAGPFTWLGELGMLHDESVSGSAQHDELVHSHEFSYTVRQGMDVLYSHDFHDWDLDANSGFETRNRLALDLIPWPWVAIQPGASLFRRENGSAGTSWLELSLMVHYFL
ncbi:MAG: hypothetical protein H6678_08250 [Candidatus Delongbacteria bacterium]|nr:hypothetical protein [Candidatus Delongbacteria bacterium]